MFCQECKKRPFCTKICKKLNRELPKDSDGRLKDENGKWIEFSFDPKIIDILPFTNREKGFKKKSFSESS